MLIFCRSKEYVCTIKVNKKHYNKSFAMEIIACYDGELLKNLEEMDVNDYFNYSLKEISNLYPEYLIRHFRLYITPSETLYLKSFDIDDANEHKKKLSGIIIIADLPNGKIQKVLMDPEIIHSVIEFKEIGLFIKPAQQEE